MYLGRIVEQAPSSDIYERPCHPCTRALVSAILREAMRAPELVEDYPDAKYGPSCLILGFTNSGRPLHVHCSHASRELVKIITPYQPSPSIWVDFKHRRMSDE
ncbi:DUF4258 domain-containing protein [Candidatus Rariloculus sp.]|uniref:DUF4258 domain-containing protein n=1 Tax=Candidatus Rariloculus sp. TaxID=3101265 RepID=UPI003D1364B2